MLEPYDIKVPFDQHEVVINKCVQVHCIGLAIDAFKVSEDKAGLHKEITSMFDVLAQRDLKIDPNVWPKALADKCYAAIVFQVPIKKRKWEA